MRKLYEFLYKVAVILYIGVIFVLLACAMHVILEEQEQIARESREKQSSSVDGSSMDGSSVYGSPYYSYYSSYSGSSITY